MEEQDQHPRQMRTAKLQWYTKISFRIIKPCLLKNLTLQSVLKEAFFFKYSQANHDTYKHVSYILHLMHYLLIRLLSYHKALFCSTKLFPSFPFLYQFQGSISCTFICFQDLRNFLIPGFSKRPPCSSSIQLLNFRHRFFYYSFAPDAPISPNVQSGSTLFYLMATSYLP